MASASRSSNAGMRRRLWCGSGAAAMLVIFDCDGVLVDSEAIFASVDAEALSRLGHPMSPAAILRRFSGMPHRDMWEILAAELGLELPADHLQTIRDECQRRFETDLVAVPGARDAVRAVQATGLATSVASSTQIDSLRRNLARTGLLDLVDPHVFSVSQVKRGKPAPDVFLHAASQTGFDPAECLVVEDSVAGVTAAGRAGMSVLGFVGGSHVDDDLGARLSDAGARAICAAMPEVVATVSDIFGI